MNTHCTLRDVRYVSSEGERGSSRSPFINSDVNVLIKVSEDVDGVALFLSTIGDLTSVVFKRPLACISFFCSTVCRVLYHNGTVSLRTKAYFLVSEIVFTRQINRL